MKHTDGLRVCPSLGEAAGLPHIVWTLTIDARAGFSQLRLKKRSRCTTEPALCPLRYEEYHYISMLRRLRNQHREHERARKTFAYTDHTGMTISEVTTAPNKTKPHVTQAVQQPRCLMRRFRVSHPENAHAKHTKRTRDGFGIRVAGRKQIVRTFGVLWMSIDSRTAVPLVSFDRNTPGLQNKSRDVSH